jgi:hypothetical protein
MQHREWNPKTFFRKVSPEVMALFEQSRALALERDPGRPEHERTYHAWKALPEEQRLSLEAELLPVNDLCTQGARPYLDNLARCVWTLRAPELIDESRDWSVYDLAVRLHVDAPADFLRCHQNYAVDMMEHFKEYRGRHPVAVHASAEAKAEMKAAMAEHFRQNAGGSRCQVEDFEGDGKLALFIYHEDEMTPVEQFDAAGTVVPVWQRPVVRVAAVFYAETCTLLVKAPRRPERELLRDLFARIFVGEDDYFEDAAVNPKFSFGALARRDFLFPTHPMDGVDHVSVTRLVVQPVSVQTKRVTLDLRPGLSLVAVHRALEHHGVDLDSDRVIGARLQFQFAEGRGRARFRTVSLFNPNSTNLRDTFRDRVIRRYLKEWGFDGSRPAFPVGAAPVAAAAGF